MRPGKALVVALAVLAASCGGTAASGDAPVLDVPDSVTGTQLQASVAASLETSLAAEALVPASCVEGLAAEISGILFADLGELGLRNLGVTGDDASVVGTNEFFAALPATTKGRVVAAVAACDGAAFQLSPQIPGVSYASFTCLIDRLSATGFFEISFVAPSIEQEESLAAVTFAKAKVGCLDPDEIEAYDAWAVTQLSAPRSIALAPVSCASIDTAPFAAVLGFDIDEFEPSVIRTDANRPVGCAYGDPDGAGPWVMLYVATQDFQRGVYEA